MTGATRTASAKLNLALHVTGRRDDGYHLLDSLVCFTRFGDLLHVAPRQGSTTLSVVGPFALGVPTGPENLILRALALFDRAEPLDISLEKNLPHAAGIGGGSADAAAMLGLLTDGFGWPLPRPEAILALGADVPVCLRAAPTRMRGIGDVLTPVAALPPLWAVLVNPGVAMPTGPVFAGLDSRDNAPMTAPGWTDVDGFFDWLAAQRNDLEGPARAIAPILDTVIEALAALPDCRLARMSGSGATCFGLFDGADGAAAKRAAADLSARHPDWWVQASPLLTG